MFIDDLRTFRVRAGLKIAELARLASVDRSTISRIERHQPSTEETLNRIVNCLNDAYYSKKGKPLLHNVVITKTSKY